MKSFTTFLYESNYLDGKVQHVKMKSDIVGTATLTVPTKEFDKNPDKSTFNILKKSVPYAKALIMLKKDSNPIVIVHQNKEYRLYLVTVEFRTKTIEEDIKQPTNVDKTRERQEREKEQLKIKQTRELEKAREQDFKKKEQDKKTKERQKQLEKETQKRENIELDFGKDQSNIYEYLEDGTPELVKAYKKSLQ